VTREFWAGRAVFVTGAAGLVGSWLSHILLEDGARVVGLVRDEDGESPLLRSHDAKRMTLVHGDLTDLRTLERAVVEYETETVFHLGAQPIVGTADELPLETFESNVRGTYNMLEACRLHPSLVRRILVASSDKAYGAQEHLPYTEDMSLDGRRPYEVSKVCADLLAQSYTLSYGLPVAIARCGNIYGGGDLNWSRLIPDTIRAILLRRRPLIRSDGKFVRDYVYVKDVVSAFIQLAEKLDDVSLHGQAFNFSPERPYTVLEVVSVIQDLLHASDLEPIIEGGARNEIHSQYLDSSKARKTLGWWPSYTLEDGLRETIAWYREFIEAHPLETAPRSGR
jgi:CDP-glucose 4,6-dehydratase